ncbi:MAG: hypothetical protein A3C90_00190 [Candidatus Magasanikbacteria bacterium RIFCSPHIGHO2_02_FULL_51_14]|uniref:Gfo/Idh/MocA-like oxidoreductase N-terminal domain-containing protein n=1 Tax=Candidatus Magasanikbacteria bacterium RIFCSPHIGHO2_02_FULL_51_14 TaxID=1798683 RepID=A0A1F6MD31_9BACT|nr:MAG: hypothetical protein A3C90_00190 [Candidatus Magasanikbacteria bacterium RIFCSPHIGHO2_02_FULL_51_14]
MKIGIIGFGSIGKRHWENLRPHGADIVVLTKRADVDAVATVSAWEDFVKRGPYDAIFITNETAKHEETISRCIELAPKAIFVEKPLWHKSAGLEELSAQLKDRSISVWVGYNFQFFAPFLRIKEVVRSGILGDIYYVRASVGQDLSEWRARDYRLCYSSQKEGGGGVMLDLVHDINYPAWLLGEKLRAEACVMRRVSDLGIDVEDCVESIFSAGSGTIVSVHQDYVRVPYKRSLEIVGSEASVCWDTDTQTVVVSNRKKEALISEKIVVDRNEMYKKEIEFFLEALRGNIYFSNVDEAIRDVRLIEALKAYANQ